MICLPLIMTMIFVNSIVEAEQKMRHSSTILTEDLDSKTKAWLLMVESGKVDEEELRRITPKSIFIAPLLTGRTEKCKEGYRHDHLGQCVKVIKIDPKVQLEKLLKRLHTLYTEKKDDEGPTEISSGPLHFSIPISGGDKKEDNPVQKDSKPETAPVNFSFAELQSHPELVPVPLPIILLNQTKEVGSGAGPLSAAEQFETSHLEGSGVESGDSPIEEDVTPSASLFPEDSDYLDARETESTTEIPSTTETAPDIPKTTTVSPEESTTTESYQSITDVLSINDSVVGLLNKHIQNPENVSNSSKSDRIHFPSDVEVRTRVNLPTHSEYIRFPDDKPQPQVFRYHTPPEPPLPTWRTQFAVHPSTIPRQQFWWLPENWKVEENQQQKSTLVKFWSRLPLIPDVSYGGEREVTIKKTLNSNHPPPEAINYQHRNNEFSFNFNHQPLHRRGQPFRSTHFFPDSVPTRQTFRNER